MERRQIYLGKTFVTFSGKFICNVTTGRIQFKILTTLPMTISSFILEFKGF